MMEFMKRLKRHRGRLTRQQLLTLRGQALAGDIVGANKGLQRLLDHKKTGGHHGATASQAG